LYLTIEINQVWIQIVEQRVLRAESQRNGQTAAEGFDVSAMLVKLPNRRDVGQQPTLAPGPFERRAKVIRIALSSRHPRK